MKQMVMAVMRMLANAAGRLAYPFRGSLSRRLLVLTILFVMLAEVMIFVPSIATFRLKWLEQHITAAQIASLALEADNDVSPALREELLRNAQVYAVALRRDDTRSLVLSKDMPPVVDTSFDLREAGFATLVMDAFETVLAGDGRVVLVEGKPNFGAGEAIEIIFDETPLRHAILRYGKTVFVLSLVISLIAGCLVYLVLNSIFVKPMRRITENVISFRINPEDARRIMMPAARNDEIGIVERELAVMQQEIRVTLTHKARLASLGAAVGKINHDLRNILANAQLISDRIGASTDPTVQHLSPRLFSSIDRAIALCTHSLKFAQVEEMPLRRERVRLAILADEAAESAWTEGMPVRWVNDVPRDMELSADPEHLFRILLNLIRNAVQELADACRNGMASGAISLRARRHEGEVFIELEDTGRGLPNKARDHLFEPFSGGTKPDGAGLGLSIAAELTRLHGGSVELVKSDVQGTIFRIRMPDEVTPAQAVPATRGKVAWGKAQQAEAGLTGVRLNEG